MHVTAQRGRAAMQAARTHEACPQRFQPKTLERMFQGGNCLSAHCDSLHLFVCEQQGRMKIIYLVDSIINSPQLNVLDPSYLKTSPEASKQKT